MRASWTCLNSLTSASFEEDFNRYLYGKESIPLAGFLQDADRMGCPRRWRADTGRTSPGWTPTATA
jgi:hypothetical protein